MIRLLLNLFLINILIFNSPLLFSAEEYEIEPNTVIVKFKSEPFNKLKDGILQGQLYSFQAVLGDYKMNNFVNTAVLTKCNNIIKQKRKDNSLLSLRENPAEQLERIYKIEYSSNIDPVTAAMKLKTMYELEYAEPVYKRYIVETPDDPGIEYQSYLNQIQAFDAWELVTSNDTVVIGVVDTGVDFDHEDLAENIWVNPGETGTDGQGLDKASNGIDDDGNGYVDDWHGWDLVSSDSLGYDNDPRPGHSHGTHVSGISAAIADNGIGISGVSINTKILPVKIGLDNQFSTSIYNGYAGILYAAMMGADVINCSWGGSGYMESEQEIITAAIELGSVVVAAAGNSNKDQQFYPSAYDGVMSVVSVDSEDKKSSFSNYHITDDISAPGTEIYSTIPLNNYDFMSGTSMASPVVSGVAALVCLQYPELSPQQVVERIKASSDNIDDINLSFYQKKMGRGRVNAYNALKLENAKAAIMTSHTFSDANGDGNYDRGESIEVDLTFLNVLDPLNNATVEALAFSEYSLDFTANNISIGDMATMEEKQVPEKISFTIPDEIPIDYPMIIEFRISDNDGYVNSEYAELILRPSYKTMDANNIAVTFNSKGNIAYNDYSQNVQGVGFRYNGSSSMLFEGAFMAGVDRIRVSNVARGTMSYEQDDSFTSDDVFTIDTNSHLAAEEGFANFSDDNDGLYDAGISVKQEVYQFDDEGREDFVIITYDVTNKSGADFDSLFAGLYFDWDVGPAGRANQTVYDSLYEFGYTYNTVDSTLPYAGVALLTSQKLNFFAVDNDGDTDENPGVYGGFDRAEKWLMLSSGIGRAESNITDASMVISGGPVALRDNNSEKFAFVLLSGYSVDNMRDALDEARKLTEQVGVEELDNYKLYSVKTYPNPADNMLNLEFYSLNEANVALGIFDLQGRKVLDLAPNQNVLPGKNILKYNINTLNNGYYILKISIDGQVSTTPLIISK